LQIYSSPQISGADIVSASIGTEFKYSSNYPTHYLVSDTPATTWSSDDKIYLGMDDSFGYWDTGTGGSNLFVSTLSNLTTSTVGTLVNSLVSSFGTTTEVSGVDGASWKETGIISVNGILYMSVSRNITPGTGGDWRQPVLNSSLTMSTDKGVTWSPLPLTEAAPFTSPMFAAGFSPPSFIQYGKDYQGNTVHNSNNYVYAVSTDGYFQGGSTVSLGRCLIDNMPYLNGAKWSYYKGNGASGMLDANWDASVSNATPIISPGTKKAGTSSVQYLPHFQRYVYISWYYPSVVNNNTMDQSSAVWDWYQSPTPWGPWTLLKSTTNSGHYLVHIAPKSVAADNGLNVVITTSGNWATQVADNGSYTLWLIPVTFA
jgi:hypothetical protein